MPGNCVVTGVQFGNWPVPKSMACAAAGRPDSCAMIACEGACATESRAAAAGTRARSMVGVLGTSGAHARQAGDGDRAQHAPRRSQTGLGTTPRPAAVASASPSLRRRGAFRLPPPRMTRSLLGCPGLLPLLSSALASLVPTGAAAQVGAGDIAISGFSSSTFGVLAAGGSFASYATGGFLGTGLSQTVLWDRTQPNAFLIGGSDFVGRATITGPGSVSYALVSSTVGLVVQMSWDDAGQIVFVDAASNQVRRLDPATGFVVDLSSGAQPWGTDATSGAWDPRNGDVVVGGSGAIYRLPAGSPTAVPVVSGLGGYVSGIAFDPVTGDIVATVLTANRVLRVDGAANVIDIAPQ